MPHREALGHAPARGGVPAHVRADARTDWRPARAAAADRRAPHRSAPYNAGAAFVVIASNAGAARPPAWYLNLRADPQARVQVGERTLDVRAHDVAGRERQTLWKRLTAANRYLDRVAHKAGRELPVLVLTPVPSTTETRRDGPS